MASAAKILRAARANPVGLRFADLCRLVEAAGFSLDHVTGSHRIFKLAGVGTVALQPKGNMAHGYQVRLVLRLIDEHKISIE